MTSSRQRSVTADGGLASEDRGRLHLSRLLRILRFHAHDLNLVPSAIAYVREGGGPRARLRFTKTGEPRIEAAYATQFVWPGKGPFHMPATPENKG